MKRIILALVMVAFYLSPIHAQVKFGLKGGVNFDNFEFKEAKTKEYVLDNSTGWQAGALLQIKIPGLGLGLQPELLYTVCKANINDETNSIHYFEVPVNLRLGVNLFLVRPYLMAGPYFGYAVNFEGKFFENDINKFDWGLGLGGGVEIWKFVLDARYSWGLQNVSSVSEFEMKNNRFTLSLGILF